MKNIPKTRQENLVTQELENEILIYDVKSNKCFCLNVSLKLIWQFCDGKNSVDKISNLMSRKLKTIVNENLVLLGLRELYREDLLEKDSDLEPNFLKSSRRELIKNIGFASVTVLPVISSVIAPSALSAQSIAGLSLFTVCTPAGPVCRPGLSCRSSINPFAPTVIDSRCCAGIGSNYTSGVSHGCYAPGTCSVFGDRCCSAATEEVANPTCSAGFLDCRCT